MLIFKAVLVGAVSFSAAITATVIILKGMGGKHQNIDKSE